MERNTHQKHSVLNALKALHGKHPTAEQIYQSVSREISTISRATVYRILNRFAGRGMIAQLHIPDSADRYDDWTAPHYHLVCTFCGSVVDLADMDIKHISLPENEVSGCKVTGVQLVFLGICQECNDKERSSPLVLNQNDYL